MIYKGKNSIIQKMTGSSERWPNLNIVRSQCNYNHVTIGLKHGWTRMINANKDGWIHTAIMTAVSLLHTKVSFWNNSSNGMSAVVAVDGVFSFADTWYYTQLYIPDIHTYVICMFEQHFASECRVFNWLFLNIYIV